MRRRCIVHARWLLAVAGVSCATPAFAAPFLVQIEEVFVGTNGDPTAQAVQIRLRTAGQNNLAGTRLCAVNANGTGLLILANFSNLPGPSVSGDRILVMTPSFANVTTPAAVADYTMLSIPQSYFAAGSLFFEDANTGVVYWRLSWGGSAYTGITTGASDNDDDPGFGNAEFGPPYPGALELCRALRFQRGATALSTSNAADYVLTDMSPTFQKYQGATYQVTGCVPIPAITALGVVVMGVALLACAGVIIHRRRTNAGYPPRC